MKSWIKGLWLFTVGSWLGKKQPRVPGQPGPASRALHDGKCLSAEQAALSSCSRFAGAGGSLIRAWSALRSL